LYRSELIPPNILDNWIKIIDDDQKQIAVPLNSIDQINIEENSSQVTNIIKILSDRSNDKMANVGIIGIP
jgi:ribosome biogenesis GTPase A